MNKGYIQLINYRRKSGIELYRNGLVLSPTRVRSESDRATIYNTTLDECSCPDYQKRHLQCKHICAQLLAQGIESEDNFIINEVDI